MTRFARPIDRPVPDRSEPDISSDTEATGTPRTVAELGEFGVIERINRGRRHTDAVAVGPGDDAAVLVVPDARVVVTTDMLVQDRHFRLDWSTPEHVGRKAIAQNGADLAAMGARPSGYVVGLGCPADTGLDVVDGLAAGMWQEAERGGAGIVGGDLVQSPLLVVSITALGDLAGRRPVLRSGAKPGDVVAVAGRLGWSAAGMALLHAADERFPDVADAHRVPQPPYAAGISAAEADATAMSDVSDGLLADLGHIAAASEVSIDVHRDAVADRRIAEVAAALDADAEAWLLAGGEDHCLVATFPPGHTLPQEWRVVGAVAEGSGVTVDGAAWRGSTGWQSFGG